MYDIQERIKVLTRFCPRCINTPDLPLRYERRVMATQHDRIAVSYLCPILTCPDCGEVAAFEAVDASDRAADIGEKLFRMEASNGS